MRPGQGTWRTSNDHFGFIQLIHGILAACQGHAKHCIATELEPTVPTFIKRAASRRCRHQSGRDSSQGPAKYMAEEPGPLRGLGKLPGEIVVGLRSGGFGR
jgi:hypothetical protein